MWQLGVAEQRLKMNVPHFQANNRHEYILGAWGMPPGIKVTYFMA